MNKTHFNIPKFITDHKYYLIFSITGLVAVIGIVLAVNYNKNIYHTGTWKTYRGNVVFEYPSSWKLSDCSNDQPFFELPGTVKGAEGGPDRLKVYAGAPYKFEGDIPCSIDEKDLEDLEDPQKGENCPDYGWGVLLNDNNGLILSPHEEADKIYSLGVILHTCLREATSTVVSFEFSEPGKKEWLDDSYPKKGPAADREAFFASQQYKDIKRFAESIRLKD